MVTRGRYSIQMDRRVCASIILARVISLGLRLLLVCMPISMAIAQTSPGIDVQRRQDVQIDQAIDRATHRVDHMSTVPGREDGGSVIVDETPCFRINRIDFEGDVDFPWLSAQTEAFIGHCLGVAGLKRVRDFLTLKLLERGFVTSRVVLPRQNLADGILLIQVIPGRVGEILERGDAPGWLEMPLATRSGHLLNQRDLDQSLENLLRLSSEAGVTIDILPGRELGESNLIIRHGSESRWQASIGIDDSGPRASGKNRITASLGIDSPLGLYDTLALTLNNNADWRNSALANRGGGLQWSLPMGYFQSHLGASQSYYKQTAEGYNAPIEYSGNSHTLEAGLALTPYRSGRYKGRTRIKLFRKVSKNYIDGIEISVQSRDMVGWELSHSHTHAVGVWSVGATASYKSSLPFWSQNDGILLGVPDWDGRYQVASLQLSASRQGEVAGHVWRYQSLLGWQNGGTHLPLSEFVALGGRYSVRGFDGERTLSAESGGSWRNELVLSSLVGLDTYFALDAGRIAGPSAQGQSQTSLAGAAVGLRGRFENLAYDLSLGWPISRPEGFANQKTPTLAASITLEIN